MVINHWISVNNLTEQRPVCSGSPAIQLPADTLTPEALYSALHSSYPKFYKMDRLCKWAWAGAEYLCSGNTLPYEGYDKNNIAVCLSTSYGCIDVDKKYLDGIAVPSPALFVYTLPNIMLGEICIRHGFKGEQACMVSDTFDAEELFFTVNGLLQRGMGACLCGWVDVFDERYDVCMFWVSKKGAGLKFSPAILQGIYAGRIK